MSKLLPQGTSVPASAQQINAQEPPPVPDQKFIPHRQFRSGVFLPDAVLANPRLSCGAKLLWARLARYAGVNGVCFPSCQTLGTDLGCSARQIQRYVAELVDAGFITAKQRGFNKSNTYTFIWHPDLDDPPRKGPHRATDVSSCSTTDAAACLSATDAAASISSTHVSPLREVKRKIEMQAERASACEVPPTASACPACISPEKAEEPLTQQEAEVMDWLRLFQQDLQIGGTVEASTVREVLKVITKEELPQALKFVAGKLMDRRRRDRHYRERMDFGFVLTVLRKDYGRPGWSNMPVVRRKDISVAPDAATAISGPPIPIECDREPRGALRNGFSSAGEILRGSGLLQKISEM